MTTEQLELLRDDHEDLLLAIKASAKFDGSVELRLDKLELGQVARLLEMETDKIPAPPLTIYDKYQLRFEYMEVDVTLYSLVLKP